MDRETLCASELAERSLFGGSKERSIIGGLSLETSLQRPPGLVKDFEALEGGVEIGVGVLVGGHGATLVAVFVGVAAHFEQVILAGGAAERDVRIELGTLPRDPHAKRARRAGLAKIDQTVTDSNVLWRREQESRKVLHHLVLHVVAEPQRPESARLHNRV